MSRCFPYPPPGYCRNGETHEALIESIKLQKETEKAKAERRKEKKAKKERKEKKKKEIEKRKNEEKLKSQKTQSQDSHKSLPKDAGFTEAQINGTKRNTELLEKSDLTQEHGQPIKLCYSSDSTQSTQNSNKRRRDDDNDVDLVHDDSTGHGKHIKIRLVKKQRGSDSSISGGDARLKTVPLVPPPNFDRSKRNNGVPTTSGRENNAVQGILLTNTKSNTRFDRTTERSPNGLHLVREQPPVKPIIPSGSRNSDVDMLKSRQQQQHHHRQQQIASFVRPVVPQSQLKQEEPSSSVVSRNVGVQVQGPISARQHHQGQSNLKPVIPGPVANKPSPITTGKRPINEVTFPSSSGPTKVQKEDLKKAGPTKAEKKKMKKQAKYEKLIGGWVPPVFQAILPEVVEEDEDWLSRKAKPANSSVSKGEVESCREVATTSLWQPRARFLAEADIYALPYTVPF